MDEELAILTFNLPYWGDLYRIFYDLSGKVYSIRFFPLMSSTFNEIEWKDLPAQVQQEFENHFCK